MRKNLFDFCELFYASHYLPIASFDGDEPICTFSALDPPLNIYTSVLHHLYKLKQNPAVFSSSLLGFYGIIRLVDSTEFVVVGPMFSDEISDDTVRGYMRKSMISTEHENRVAMFLSSIPKYTYNQFLNLLAYLHFSLNGERISIIDHFQFGDKANEEKVASIHLDQSLQAKETQQTHGTFHFEKQMLDYVRRGETEKLNEFLLATLKSQPLKEGVLADNPLRQAKNLLIGLITMVGKVGAIDGGMDVEEVYHLIDIYIQECEKAQSLEAVKVLQYNMLLDFTDRVAQSQIPVGTSKEVFSCVQFIKNHTNDHIGVMDVATHIGKSRAYIAKKFKKEIGMNIGAFITQSKLREAQSLLKYSDMTIAEISNYLCFSSQSYFQNVFKNECGITPAKYRKYELKLQLDIKDKGPHVLSSGTSIR